MNVTIGKLRWWQGLLLALLAASGKGPLHAQQVPCAICEDCPCFTAPPVWQDQVRRDWDELPCRWLSDVECVFRRQRVVPLLAMGGISWAIHETIDDDVADWTEEHPNRWGKGQEIFAALGNPGHHFAAIAGLYGYSLYHHDDELHELSLTMFNAVSITGTSTMLLKVAAGTGTRAPNGQDDPFGGAWPSGHTSSAFAVASVLDEWYGPSIGVPALVLAGLAGWERVDDREHDLSDVVFGAALGYVVGKSVTRTRLQRLRHGQMRPYYEPGSESAGVAWDWRF